MTGTTQRQTERPATHAAAQELQAPMGAYSLSSFCTAFAISRTSLYRLWAKGQGPKVMKPGGPTGKTFISHAAALEWQASVEGAFAKREPVTQ